jgi:hypothetical protein
VVSIRLHSRSSGTTCAPETPVNYKGSPMYIGGGLIVLILIVIVIVLLLR